MVKCKQLISFFPVLTLLISLCACAAKPEPVILSAEEVEALRETYPLEDSMVMASSATFDYAFSKSNAVAVVEVIDEWEIRSMANSPLSAVNGPPLSTDGPAYLPVKINKILYSDGSLEEGDEINMFFGSTLFFDDRDAYPVGGRFLCFIGEPGESSVYYDDTVHSCNLQMSAYLTPDDHILSITHKGPFVDYTGYALDSYAVELEELIKNYEPPESAAAE